MRYTRLLIPFTLAMLSLTAFLILCADTEAIKAASLQQYDDWPRIYDEDPGTCTSPTSEPLPVPESGIYVLDESDTQGEDTWAYVNGGEAEWDDTGTWYICPPPSWTTTTMHIESTQYSYGEYRNEHALELDRGSYSAPWSYVTAHGAGCGGFTDIVDEVAVIPVPSDPGYLPYRLRYYVRAYSRNATCNAHAQQDLQIWFDEYTPEESPESVNYCPDGTELITNPVTLSQYDSWVGNVNTGWDKLYARYTISAVHGTAYLADLWLNDTRVGRQGYVHSDGPTVFSYTVPNRTDPTERDMNTWEKDYDKYAYEEGPVADLMFENKLGDVTLASACVIQAYDPLTPSQYCPDGLELLREPLEVGAVNGFWETTAYGIEYQHITVKYVVEPKGALDTSKFLKAVPGINYNLYWVEGKFNQEKPTVTFTLPTTGVVKLLEPNVPFEWNNYGDEMIVRSICILDAQETMLQKTQEECHLVNPDFVDGVGGWGTDGSVTWDYYEENGLVELEGDGAVFQAPIQERGTVWKMEIRARSLGGADTVTFGTETDSLIYGGAQSREYDLEPGAWYTVLWDNIFVEDGGHIHVTGNDAAIDYVCLVEPTDILPVPNCERPIWDPAGSGDPLLIYLIKYLADIVIFVGCTIIRAVSLAFNGFIDFVRNALLRIPALPDPGDGLYSWLEWALMWLDRYYEWLGFNVHALADWIADFGNDFPAWLRNLYTEFIFWLAEQLEVDPFFLLDLLDAVWDEALLFWDEIAYEIDLEFQDLLLLLQNMANVFITLANGVREGVSGETIAYIGDDFEGVGAFIWTGVDFLNTAIASTPLSAINLVALGAIAIGLFQWTAKKFINTLESVG